MVVKKIVSCVTMSMVLSGLSPTINTIKADDEDFSNLKITYTSPTAVKSSSGGWTFGGIPVGNGKIGAKIYGGVDVDVYQLNDASFWSGGPEYTNICDETGNRKKALDKTRELLQGDLTDWDNITEIEKSAKNMVGDGVAGSYMPVGNLLLDFGDDTSYSNYKRTLDLDTASVVTEYEQNGVNYKRTSFVSYPDNVMVIKLESDGDDTLDFKASLTFPDEKPSGEGSERLEMTDDNEYVMSWRAPVVADTSTWSDNYGMTVEARIKILETGGNVSYNADGIQLQNANEAVIIYSSETSYNGFDKNPTLGSGEEKDPAPLLDEYLSNASEKTYDELYNAHLNDYRDLFRRVWVNIEDNEQYALAYQYKRYELISCNRTGDFFRMGYGMWNPQMKPTSWGNHYLNEQVQKESVILESANLSELQRPVIKWLENLADNGSKTAEYDFGFRGWIAPHHSDIWATTGLQADGSKRTEWAIFPVGGMWSNLMVWEHYLYTKDEDFLRDTAYPLFEGAAEFACDWLVEREFTADETSGEPGTYLVTSPSTSAENSYGLNYGAEYKSGLFEAVSVGTTQDMTIVREVFDEYISTCEILGIENDLLNEVKDKKDRLLPYQIHNDGELQEWAFEEMKPNQERDIYSVHRHASQLLGIWPYNTINEDETPELYKAAKIALENRGSGARMPDKAAMWVRLGEPDKALENIATSKGDLIDQWGANVQNAFVEFIVQSQNGYIDLLPALPTTWKNGEIRGTCVRGGYELDIKWSDGQLESCVVYSNAGGEFPEIRLNDEIISESDSRITFVENPNTDVEAENISADIKNISKNEEEITMDYSVKSNDDNTATRVTSYLAVYNVSGDTPVLCNIVSKTSKIYNTQSYSGSLKFDGRKYVGDNNKYLFKGFVWKTSDGTPLDTAALLDNVEFEVKEIYDSAIDFSGEQGPVWYYRSCGEELNFSELGTYNADGEYWQGDYTYLRVGGTFMHPQTLNAVRTFKAPADGSVLINKSIVKADDSKGTTDGINIKIVKQSADGKTTEQIYPQGDGYLTILNSDHKAGVEIPEITVDLKQGDTINFVLNQGEGNAHDGTQWHNKIEYIK